MSFSSGIKENLVKVKLRQADAQRACLAGLTHACASLRLSKSGVRIQYATETLAVGKSIAALASALYRLEATIELSQREHRSRTLTVVTLSGQEARRLLLDVGALWLTEDGALSFEKHIPDALIATDECVRAFLRGSFCGSGSCANPARVYHLELLSRTKAFADRLASLIGDYGLDARVMERRGRFVVYLKGDDVSGFLALIGASGGALSYETVRTAREMRNYINRTSNCETGNIGKTINAGLMQVMAIERIERHMPLERLPQPLYEAAVLRLQNQDATLQQLADMAEIGKSGMNHRLARLMKMAEELGDG